MLSWGSFGLGCLVGLIVGQIVAVACLGLCWAADDRKNHTKCENVLR